jgi:type IV pilus assembly protein PilP
MPSRMTRVSASSFRMIVLGALTLAVTACSSSMGELDTYIAEVKSREVPPPEPPPVLEKFESFTYEAHDLRDPFSNPGSGESIGATAGPRPDPDRRKEPLESFPLDGLDMVGTLGGGDGLVALVMDPERVIHRVTVGNYMGQNDGRIVSITEDKISLTELAPDSAGTGKWLQRDASVSLDDE